MKKIVIIILLSLALIVCLAACESADISIIGGADGPTKIYTTDKNALDQVTIVLDWTPNINHSGLYAAVANGYFAEQGLEVEIVQPGDNYALQLVAAGQAEFGISYQEEVTFARSADIGVKSIAAVIQHNTSCFDAPVANNIQSIADFSGKTYGGWGGEVEEALINYLVEKEGLSEPVQIINIGSADFFAATETNIDFSWIYYGVTGIEAELRGVELDTIYLKDIDATFDYYTPVIIAEEGWLSDNADIATRFLAAVSQGYQFADDNPEQTAEILLLAAPELSADLVQRGQEWMAGQYQADASYWGEQQQGVWQDFADWLYQRGLISEKFAAEDAFTNQYLPQ